MRNIVKEIFHSDIVQLERNLAVYNIQHDTDYTLDDLYIDTSMYIINEAIYCMGISYEEGIDYCIDKGMALIGKLKYIRDNITIEKEHGLEYYKIDQAYFLSIDRDNKLVKVNTHALINIQGTYRTNYRGLAFLVLKIFDLPFKKIDYIYISSKGWR